MQFLQAFEQNISSTVDSQKKILPPAYVSSLFFSCFKVLLTIRIKYYYSVHYISDQKCNLEYMIDEVDSKSFYIDNVC